MVELEARRVQKLGASSLIITLPKEWARELEIKPGTIVYLRREGNTIRILPPEKRREETVDIEFEGEHGKKLALRALTCLYILGITDARIKGRGFNLQEVEIEAKRRALDLIGVEAFSEKDHLRVRVLVEVDKSNLEIFSKTVALNAAKAFSLLSRIVSGYTDAKLILEEVELLQKEAMKYQHAILRAFSRSIGDTSEMLSMHLISMISRHLVLATNMVLDNVRLLLDAGLSSFDENIADLAGRVSRIVSIIADSMVSGRLPDYDFLEQEISEIIRTGKSIVRERASRLNVQAGIVLACIIPVTRLLNVITIMLTCKEIIDSIKKKSQS